MEVTITQFRKEMFELVNRALEGTEVWVRHKGRRFKIAPEGQATSRLSRITPMAILNPGAPDLDDPAAKAAMQSEMEKAWEKDWSDL